MPIVGHRRDPRLLLWSDGLVLVAERTPSLELPVWACDVSMWTPSLGDLIIPLFTYQIRIPHIQTVPLFTVQYCYLNTRLSQSAKLPVFPRVAQGFVCWVFMQPRRLVRSCVENMLKLAY